MIIKLCKACGYIDGGRGFPHTALLITECEGIQMFHVKQVLLFRLDPTDKYGRCYRKLYDFLTAPSKRLHVYRYQGKIAGSYPRDS